MGRVWMVKPMRPMDPPLDLTVTAAFACHAVRPSTPAGVVYVRLSTRSSWKAEAGSGLNWTSYTVTSNINMLEYQILELR